MKAIIYLCLSVLFVSCRMFTKVGVEEGEKLPYMIKTISSINSWHIIYAERQGISYKIVIGEQHADTNKYEKIIVGKEYMLYLVSRRENAPIINGMKIAPVNYIDAPCHHYDEETVICIEPDKGIYDIYYTNDLRGLYYQKK